MTQQFETLVAAAEAAGMAAGNAAKPVPVVVGTLANGKAPTTLFGNDIDYSKKTYFEADGVCGFAWVKFAGNTPFGRWMKKAGKARPGYPNGLAVSVPYFNQSLQRKEAFAHAYAKVLQAEGIDAYADSRMD